jgi:hypothetical protein
MKRIAALLAGLLLACGSPHAQLIQSKQITPQSVVNTGNYATHAALLTAVTGFVADTLTQAGFTESGDGGASTYTWSGASYCPGGTSGSPVAADSIVCILPTGQSASTAGRYILQGGPNLDVRSIGMAPGGQDNSPSVPALMATMGSPPNNLYGGYTSVFSGVYGQAPTFYQFSSSLVISRGGTFTCSGSQSGGVYLVFPAGVDGVIQEDPGFSPDGGSASGSVLDSCQIISQGFGSARGAQLSNTLTGVFQSTTPPGIVTPSPFGDGDGIMLTGGEGAYDHPIAAGQNVPPGTTVTNVAGSVNGSITLTLSNTITPLVRGLATANFIENTTHDFLNTDTIQVGNNTFTFVSGAPSAGQIQVTGVWATDAASLVSAINTNASGATWGAPLTTPNISAAIVNTLTVHQIVFTALAAGTATNSYPSIFTSAAVLSNQAGAFDVVTGSGGPVAGQFWGGEVANATFTGTISGTTLTFPSLTTGSIILGNMVVGTGVAPGTVILSGSGLSWTVNNSQSVGPVAMSTVYAEDVRFLRLPASQQFNVTTVTGDNKVTIISGPRLMRPGDGINSDAFPFGTTAILTRAASVFTQTGGLNFSPGETITAGNNTYTAVSPIGATPCTFLVGANFSASTSNLAALIVAGAGSGTLYNACSTTPNVSARSETGAISFWANTNPPTGASYVSTTTSVAGTFQAGTFTTQEIYMDTSAFTGSGQNALVSHSSGSGQMWTIPVALKRDITSASRNVKTQYFGFGFKMACSTASPFNCDSSRDESLTNELDYFGRWDAGNNIGTSGIINEVGANNYVMDWMEGATGIGTIAVNYNANSTESGTSPLAIAGSCSNSTPVFGGYITGGLSPGCAVPAGLFPMGIGSPFLVIGPDNTYPLGSRGIKSSGASAGTLFGNWIFTPPSVLPLSAADTRCFGLMNSIYAWGWSNNSSCASASTWGTKWEPTNSDWVLGFNSNQMRFMATAEGYTGYAGSGIAVGPPNGLMLGGDGNANPVNGSRLLGAAEAKPSANWHLQGDTTINTIALPGGTGDWHYAPTFTTTLTGAVTKGTTTSVGVTACPPSALPTTTLISDTALTPDANLGFQTSCTGTTLTFSTTALNSSLGSNDAIQFLQVYGAAPISNSTSVPDYTAQAVRSGSSSNTDLTGRITLSGGTATYNLTETYASAPNCLTADVTTPANASSVSESTTVLTFTGTGTDVIKYQCNGRN